MSFLNDHSTPPTNRKNILMKIKKKNIRPKHSLQTEGIDRNIFWLVIIIILITDLLLMYTAFPAIDNMMAAGMDPGRADSPLMFKVTMLVIIDIFLFVTLYMFFSRRQAKNRKK